MKKASLALIIGTTLVLSACGSDKKVEKEVVTYTTEVQKESYALGARMGMFAKEQVKTQLDMEIDTDRDAMLAGFTEAFNGESQFTDEEIQELVKSFSVKYQAAEQSRVQASSAENIEAGKAFLTENATKDGIKVTDSGLQYEVLTEGEGASPAAEDTVKVHYHGTLMDGTVFDSSVDRGQPAEFPLNRVISGWTEGVQLMKVGSKYRFYIPSELAYGQRATGAIPPHSTLIFEVELLDIAPFDS